MVLKYGDVFVSAEMSIMQLQEIYLVDQRNHVAVFIKSALLVSTIFTESQIAGYTEYGAE